MAQLSDEERDLQLQFCEEVLDELTAPKHRHLNKYIIDPRHDEASTWACFITTNCPYIQRELSQKEYEGFEDFEASVERMFVGLGQFSCLDCAIPQLRTIFEEKWADRHAWVNLRSSSSTGEPVAPSNPNIINGPSAAPSKRNATTADLGSSNTISTNQLSSVPHQPAAKKLRLMVTTPPPTERKYTDLDKVLVKDLHKSLSEYLLEIKSATYDRATTQWRYNLFNNEAMGKSQIWVVPEEDIIKSEYEIDAVYRLHTASGEMVGRKVKVVRLVDDKVEYDTVMTENRRTFSAAEMANLVVPHV